MRGIYSLESHAPKISNLMMAMRFKINERVYLEIFCTALNIYINYYKFY